MPTFFDRDGTSINIDSGMPRRSATTGTQARKFAAPDTTSEQETRDVDVVSNDEHATTTALGLKDSATIAEALAMASREGLGAMRKVLDESSALRSNDPTIIASLNSVLSAEDSRARFVEEALRNTTLSRSEVEDVVGEIARKLPSRVFRKKLDDPEPLSINNAVPNIDSISVDIDKNRGSVDCFFADLKISLPTNHVDSGRVKAFRIFRSTILNPAFKRDMPHVLSSRAIERLTTNKLRTRSKNNNAIAITEFRMRESGVPNSLTLLSPTDPSTNMRTSAEYAVDSTSQTSEDKDSKTSLLSAFAGSSFIRDDVARKIDVSVVTDMNVIKNILRSDPSVTSAHIPNDISFDPRGKKIIDGDNFVVSSNNFAEFREIAFVSFDKIKSKNIGDSTVFHVIDETISYARGYRYYVTTVDVDMVESVRSQIVDVTVEAIRIPERPKRVYAQVISDKVALNTIVDDQLVEKFEIYRRDAELSRKSLREFVTTIHSVAGYTSDIGISSPGKNNFSKVGESLNGSRFSGANFYDHSVVPGRRYEYRVYSVDIFGNKSESPYDISIFVPDRYSRINELKKPSMTAEVDSKTGKARVTFRCSDERVKMLFLSRRDVTVHQKAFVNPAGVSHIKLGTPKVGEGAYRFEDILLRGQNKDVAWTGMFENSGNETVFIDTTVSRDHTYQYMIYGVDRYGNRTPNEISRTFLVSGRPMINNPVNVTADVMQGENFTVGGVRISWHVGDVDISTEDMLGNRDDLTASSVRTLYQVERKKVGEELWTEFPMVESTVFFDPAEVTLGPQVPNFRPPVVEPNQTYMYRVKALQTGSYFSNYSNIVQVYTALPMIAPSNFRIKHSDTKVKPFYVTLNWDTPNNSGVVDKWEIERAEINNFAAAKFNIKNPADFKALEFKKFREVYRESSRFRSHLIDDFVARKRTFDKQTLLVGDHGFQDTAVNFGNTYFYRIRSVGVDGSMSTWSYRGIKLTEETIERTLTNTLTNDVKTVLESMNVPLVMPAFNLPPFLNSFSMQPQFSKPTVLPKMTAEKQEMVNDAITTIMKPSDNSAVSRNVVQSALRSFTLGGF